MAQQKNFTKMSMDNMKKIKLDDIEIENLGSGLLSRDKPKKTDMNKKEEPIIRVAKYVKLIRQKREELKNASNKS